MADERLSLEDIVDAGLMGSEPSPDYLEALDMLDNVVRECMHVSRGYGGIPSPTARHFYASVLFVQMITKCVSLLNLAPHSPWADKKIEHWDYGSMTGVARTLIELRVAYYYLCVDDCSEEEWRLRWDLFNLHDCCSRRRLFEALGADDQVKAYDLHAEELRKRLRNNDSFQALDPKRHKKLLHGQMAYLFPLEVIAERAGIDLASFRWLYVLFSSHVHALPMSFYRLGADDGRGRGLPSPVEEGYSSLCLTLAATLLVTSRDDLHHLLGLYKEQAETEVRAQPSTDMPAFDGPPELTVGEERVVDVSDEIAFPHRCNDADTATTAYVYRASGDVVLERHDGDSEGAGLHYFDPYFWTVRLNDAPATEAMLEQAVTAPHIFRVDHEKRTILFKTVPPQPEEHQKGGYLGPALWTEDTSPGER